VKVIICRALTFLHSLSTPAITPTTASSVGSSTSQPPTSSTLASFSNSPTASATFVPSSDCKNGTTYNSLYQKNPNDATRVADLTFTMVCSAWMWEFNVATAFVYTFEDCIELCAGINFQFAARPCVGVSYDIQTSRPANCWAHNASTLTFAPGNDAAILAS